MGASKSNLLDEMDIPVAGYLVNSSIRYAFHGYECYPKKSYSCRQSILFIRNDVAILLTGRCSQVRFYIISIESMGLYWIRVQHPQQAHKKCVEFLQNFYKPTTSQLAKFVERCVYETNKHQPLKSASLFAQYLPTVCCNIVLHYSAQCTCGAIY